MRLVRAGTVAALAVLIAACDTTKPIEPTAQVASDCARCHGNPPPPFIAGGTTHTTDTRCSICHPGTVEADNVTIVPGGLHMNGVVDAGHDLPFVAQHTAAALSNIATCQSCHGADYGGGVAQSCNACHASNVAASAPDWKTNCTFCHGTRTAGVTTATREAAPPQPVVMPADETVANPKVGAHQAHLTQSSFANALPCASCHAVPTSAEALTHFTGNGAPGAISFSALATKGAAGATYTSGTCAVYCHGSGTEFTDPAATHSPAWTTSTPITCGDCHALPPASGPSISAQTAHAFHVTTQAVSCSRCHPVPPGQLASHVNGTKDVVVQPSTGGPVTIAGWNCNACHSALGLPLAHTMPYLAEHTSAALTPGGLAGCTPCHGADYSGGTGPSCNACHATSVPASAPDWKTNCTFCHGTRTANFAGTPVWLPAPPQTVAGTGDQTTSAPKVGAHQRHVGNGSALSNGVACSECHPAATDLTHIGGSGTAQLAWGPLASNAGAPTDMTSGTCANYCHGATLPGNAGRTRPTWAPPTAMTCASCHDSSPTTGKHPDASASPHSGFACSVCHGTGFTAGTSVNKAVHVDGSVFKAATLLWQDTPVKSCDPSCHARQNW